MILAEREKYARRQAENVPNIRGPAPKQEKDNPGSTKTPEGAKENRLIPIVYRFEQQRLSPTCLCRQAGKN